MFSEIKNHINCQSHSEIIYGTPSSNTPGVTPVPWVLCGHIYLFT